MVSVNANSTSRLNLKWTELEIEELKRQRYVAKKETKDIVIEGKTKQAITKKLQRINPFSNVELVQLDKSKWTSVSAKKLIQMFEQRTDWTDEETRNELGRSLKACKQKYQKYINGKFDLDDKIIETVKHTDHLVQFLKFGKKLRVTYLGAFTSNSNENGLLRVKQKITLYK